MQNSWGLYVRRTKMRSRIKYEMIRLSRESIKRKLWVDALVNLLRMEKKFGMGWDFSDLVMQKSLSVSFKTTTISWTECFGTNSTRSDPNVTWLIINLYFKSANNKIKKRKENFQYLKRLKVIKFGLGCFNF